KTSEALRRLRHAGWRRDATWIHRHAKRRLAGERFPRPATERGSRTRRSGHIRPDIQSRTRDVRRRSRKTCRAARKVRHRRGLCQRHGGGRALKRKSNKSPMLYTHTNTATGRLRPVSRRAPTDPSLALPRYELRSHFFGPSDTELEVWQLPSPATPTLTAPVRVAGLRGRNLELVEHRVVRRLKQIGVPFEQPAL